MAVLIRTWCCSSALQTGIFHICLLGLLWSGYAIYYNIQAYKTLTELKTKKNSNLLEEALPVDYKYLNVVTKLNCVGIAFGAISFLANLSLLGSYGTWSRKLAYPWVIWEIFMVLYTFGVTIFQMIIWNGFAFIFVVNILGWILSIYFILVVYSYIEILRDDPSAFDTYTGVSSCITHMVMNNGRNFIIRQQRI
ncbi:hypothetical protein ACROYT_G044634 [Oculina patagonica]